MDVNNDLISRSALLSKRRTIKPPECNSCEYEYMEYVRAEDVQNAPAVDAESVRHGRWENGDGIYDTCTNCREEIYQAFQMNYCPCCGAKMDGVQNDKKETCPS